MIIYIMAGLIDSYNRSITYLRVSVTDRCNLRCIYCMPPEGIALLGHDQIMRYEAIQRLVRVAASLGVSHVRLTGGEPLVRPGVVDLVAMLAPTPGLDELAMTTNGLLLARYAERLREAGLNRVNVSLDTLRPDRFAAICRYGHLEDVLDGIAAAQRAGLTPVKINVVLLPGVNDDEALDFAERSRADGWHVRFIEPMPLGDDSACAGGGIWQSGYIPSADVRRRIEAALGPLEPTSLLPANGPAQTYRLSGAAGTIGFISPLSEHFCDGCNRLRLTADGRLRPCLLSDIELDVRDRLHGGASDDDIADMLRQAAHMKPEGHSLAAGVTASSRRMAQIGG